MNILVLCTGNSARSIIGEVLITELGRPRGVRGYSAGSMPKGEPHPLALKVLEAHGHSTRGLSSKSWDVFAEPDAPVMDAIITVCDSAAAETCPVWPGAPVQVHWGLEDPAAVVEEGRAREAFKTTYDALKARVEAFLAHDWSQDAPRSIRNALEAARV